MNSQEVPKVMAIAPEQVAARYSAVLAAMQVAAKIIAIRFFLFLSLVGSFALAIIATENGQTQSSLVLFLYACVTTLPLAVLEIIGRKQGG